MKRFFAISIVVGLTMMVIKPMAPYLEYALKREFIANNYCVNQDKPAMKCNGSCYLMQRIKAQAENAGNHGKVAIHDAQVQVNLVLPPTFAWNLLALDANCHAPAEAQTSMAWIAPPVDPPPQRS